MSFRTHIQMLDDIVAGVAAEEFGGTFQVGPHAGFMRDDEWRTVPDVLNDPTGDVDVMGTGWTPLTGMTGQYAYNGACMHPSEYVGRGVAARLLEEAQDAGRTLTYALVTVESHDEDDEEPVGWAILRLDA